MPPSTGLADLDREALKTALAEEPALTLSFYSFGVLLRRRTERGLVEHPVSPADVAAALAARTVFDSGLLGERTLCVRHEGAQRTVAEYRRPQRTALWLEGVEDALRVPLPGLVLVRTTTAGRAPDHRLWAVKERPASYDAPLCHAPLPNVYGGGGVCWGTVARVTAEHQPESDLSADWDQLLATPFGNHSVSGKSKQHPDDVRRLILELEGRGARVYPKRDLVPAGRTLGQALGVAGDG